MDNKEAINWLTRIRDRLMTTSSKQFEALTFASPPWNSGRKPSASGVRIAKNTITTVTAVRGLAR